MSINPKPDLRLLSWNVLAPCWVNQPWYPTLFELAANYEERFSKIVHKILSLDFDVVLIQEAQEDIVPLLKQKLNDFYVFHHSWNHPTAASVPNGLLTLIRKDWKYASTVTVNNDILDEKRGEAIQIITLPTKNIHIVNVHLDYNDHLCQAKMVKDKCRRLLNINNDLTIVAGDMNSEREECNQFEWHDLVDVFHEANDYNNVPTFYWDPGLCKRNTAIDHIFYNPSQIKLIEYGKAWNNLNGSLKDALLQLGSDHIYVWATFNFFS